MGFPAPIVDYFYQVGIGANDSQHQSLLLNAAMAVLDQMRELRSDESAARGTPTETTPFPLNILPNERGEPDRDTQRYQPRIIKSHFMTVDDKGRIELPRSVARLVAGLERSMVH